MTLEELHADYSFKNIDLMKKEQKSPEYLKIQPFGKVPVWEEEGGNFRLFESRAILKYLAAGSKLYPVENPRLCAMIEQWMSVEYSYFGTSWGPIFGEKILKKRGDPSYEPNEELCAVKTKELIPTLDLMNAQLSATQYIAGDEFTIADVTFLPYFALFTQAGLATTLSERPELSAWVEKCLARESWVYVKDSKVLEREN